MTTWSEGVKGCTSLYTLKQFLETNKGRTKGELEKTVKKIIIAIGDVENPPPTGETEVVPMSEEGIEVENSKKLYPPQTEETEEPKTKRTPTPTNKASDLFGDVNEYTINNNKPVDLNIDKTIEVGDEDTLTLNDTPITNKTINDKDGNAIMSPSTRPNTRPQFIKQRRDEILSGMKSPVVTAKDRKFSNRPGTNGRGESLIPEIYKDSIQFEESVSD